MSTTNRSRNTRNEEEQSTKAGFEQCQKQMKTLYNRFQTTGKFINYEDPAYSKELVLGPLWLLFLTNYWKKDDCFLLLEGNSKNELEEMATSNGINARLSEANKLAISRTKTTGGLETRKR